MKLTIKQLRQLIKEEVKTSLIKKTVATKTTEKNVSIQELKSMITKVIKEEIYESMNDKPRPSNYGIALHIQRIINLSRLSIKASKYGDKELALHRSEMAMDDIEKVFKWREEGGIPDEPKEHGDEEFDFESPVYEDLLALAWKETEAKAREYKEAFGEFPAETIRSRDKKRRKVRK